MKKLAVLLVVSLFLSSLSAMANPVNVAASFSILSDIVKQIGGKHVHVNTMIRPGGDPHSFEPSPHDSKLLLQADIMFVSGLGLEGWLDRFVKSSGYQREIIIASKGINTQQTKEDGKKITDPHAWNSMKNGVLYATNVMNHLIKIDPKNEDYFRHRGMKYIQKLKKLNLWAKKQFASVPLEKRKVLISHDAFGYFQHEYGVIFLAPIGSSATAEASAKDVASLIKQIKQSKVSTYFVDNQTDSRLVKQIASATGARFGGELYPETLSGEHGSAATYVNVFKHNVNMLISSMKQ